MKLFDEDFAVCADDDDEDDDEERYCFNIVVIVRCIILVLVILAMDIYNIVGVMQFYRRFYFHLYFCHHFDISCLVHIHLRLRYHAFTMFLPLM